ncbi:LysR family transcriptional regulator [Mycolicibacter terrae]|uniref:LysR family transcriptional regulator n=2 Tax=Mycolicibacter TaxID=1073531 RepID=A0ACD2EQP9_9MYCO|nr:MULTISPECIES: LysR substrate-binding domain-containing protein [Mycolicibacter]OBH15873.1 hyaluronan synthase [Mycolicibacter sinensis]OBI26264.1 hyaluronan synthase [Mycolicibacter sinensis]RRR47302.1 LysR family transcriptional regulator [Mycolicibacter terrae]
MEIRQLQHFVAVAESGHFTHAAEALHISQSGLSASIRALEKSVSTPVFERTTRSVVLTAAGRALLGPARRILREVAAAESAVASIRDAEAGQLALGVVQTFTAVDLPATIARLHARHRGIQVLLREAPTSDLLASVDDGELDLAFVALDAAPLPAGLAALRDYPETLVLVVGAGHPLARRTTVRIADLAEQSFVEFAAGLGLQTVVAALFRDAGVQRRIAFRTSQMDQALSLVEHGLGVAVVPEPVARPSGLHIVRLRPISGAKPPTRRLALVGRTAVPTNPAARAFMDLLPAA